MTGQDLHEVQQRESPREEQPHVPAYAGDRPDGNQLGTWGPARQETGHEPSRHSHCKESQ